MAMVYKFFKVKAFTLIELLVTISIIAILTSIGLAAFGTAQKRGRDARRKADIKSIQKAMEQCYAVDEVYPSFAGTITCNTGDITMHAIPSDPKSGLYIESGTWDDDTYRLCADLEDDGVWDGTNEDICVNNLQ